jgi:hypothetical protein
VGKKGRVINMLDSSNEIPKVAAVVSHVVNNFDTWKLNFDEQDRPRVAAGITGHHLNREMDNPKHVTGFFPCSDRDETEAFFASDEMAERMRESGVIGTPHIDWVQPIRYDGIGDRQLPAALIVHHVDDFNIWLAEYDAADGLRRDAGILGDSVNRSLDDPSLVIVYHQAETFKELRDFLTSAEVIAVMQRAGVAAPPDITYHLGDYGTNYADNNDY